MSEIPLVVSLWRSFSRGRRDNHTWRSFIDTFVKDPEIVRNKKKVAGFSLASFEDNRRTLDRTEKVYALVLDLDHGTPTFEAVASLFPKTIGVIYTTHSHEPDAPRLRAIFPHSRPVTASEHDRIWAWAENKCAEAGLEIDTSARDASRLFFLPSHRPGAEYRFSELDGKPLDVERALAEAPTAVRSPDGGSTCGYCGRSFEPSEKFTAFCSKRCERKAPITHPVVVVPCEGLSQHGTTTTGVRIDRSSSGKDWHLALQLMREGADDDEVIAELRETSKKFLEKGRHGEAYLEFTVTRAREVHEAHAPTMHVVNATLQCLEARFAYPERRHIDLELSSEDGELAKVQVIIPAPWASDAAIKTWRACFPDIDADSLLGDWEETRAVWRRIKWKRRRFDVAVRNGEVRWIRAAGASRLSTLADLA